METVFARCRWRVAAEVGVHHAEGSPAHWSGIERCASIWACPVCSAVIRNERAEEIQHAADTWTARGGSVVMATFTTRHKAGDALAENLGIALAGWRTMLRQRGWKSLTERLGVGGYVRALEVTWSWVNGWHPHVHALLLVEGVPSVEELAQLEAELFELWGRIVVKLGGRTLVRGVGVKVSRATSASYVAKVQEHDRAGLEMARLDLKSGRQGSLMPFELLDAPQHRDRWLEYVDATWNRRAITWSKGLKALVGLEDRTDEEVIADTEGADLVALIPGAEYDRMRSDPLALVEVLEAVEGGPVRAS